METTMMRIAEEDMAVICGKPAHQKAGKHSMPCSYHPSPMYHFSHYAQKRGMSTTIWRKQMNGYDQTPVERSLASTVRNKKKYCWCEHYVHK